MLVSPFLILLQQPLPLKTVTFISSMVIQIMDIIISTGVGEVVVMVGSF